MWEQIRANKRKSLVLIVFMAVLLSALGFSIGAAWAGGQQAGIVGLAVALVVTLVLSLVAFAGGDDIMLAGAGAHKIEKSDMPQLWNVVEEMTIASGLPKMPEVYLIESNEPNAFAVGTPQHAVVAVTTALVTRLNRDELQGVVAHEIGHVANYDCRFMVLAGVMLGAIVLIADLFWRGLFWGGGRVRSERQGGGQAQAILFVAAIVLAVLAPIFARLLYFACSRKREYLADASSARFTRYPEGLASALEKIQAAVTGGGERVNRVVAPMYIINPLTARSAMSLWSTHPPTDARVKVLRSMAGGASYAQYEAAFRAVTGKGVIGASALADAAETPVRAASAAAEPALADRRREAMDTLYRKSGFRVGQCPCGTRIKVPPGYEEKEITCPSCGRTVAIG